MSTLDNTMTHVISLPSDTEDANFKIAPERFQTEVNGKNHPAVFIPADLLAAFPDEYISECSECFSGLDRAPEMMDGEVEGYVAWHRDDWTMSRDGEPMCTACARTEYAFED